MRPLVPGAPLWAWDSCGVEAEIEAPCGACMCDTAPVFRSLLFYMQLAGGSMAQPLRSLRKARGPKGCLVGAAAAVVDGMNQTC